MLGLYVKLYLKLVVFWFIIVPLQGQTLKITSSSNKVFVRRGDNLSLNITYEYTGKNIVGVIWKNGSTVIIQKSVTGTTTPGNSRASLNGVNLVLKNVDSYDEATYEVQLFADGILDVPRRGIKVIVTERPETEINCKVENDGNDILCDCSCIGGNPTPSATWYFKNINISGTGTPKNTLSLKNIKMADAGTYNCTCQSHNLKSGKEKKLFSPTNICFSSKKTKETVYVDKTATITCETEGYPTPTYTLYHNGSELTKNIVDGKYNIGKVKYDDAGLYKCVATNNLGNASNVFELIVSADEIPLRFTTTLPPSNQTNCKDIAKSEKSGGSTQAYVVVLTFIGGTVFGMVLSYGIFLVCRWFLKRKNNPSNDQHSTHNYENAGADKNPTYQELDLSKMNEGENYQSLKMNSRSLKHNETPKEKEVGYAELNQVKGNKDENYQSLNRV